MTYIKKIDAMRGFAVMMVVMSHWVPKTSRTIPFGEIGVDIFFVISGFLITRILLVEKEKAIESLLGFSSILKNFIFRRALRIFPIYYLSLFIFWLLQDYEKYNLREHILYYVSYTSNILFFNQNSWDGYLAPTWSLAVEEQFYLFWPFLIVLIPRRYSLKIIVLSIATGIVFPWFFENEMVKVLTPSCMNALGSGALLAWLYIYNEDFLRKYRTVFSGVVFGSLILISLGMLAGLFNSIQIYLRSFISILALTWIMYCIGIYKPLKLVEWITNNALLLFIGRVSYGIYLYHNLVSIVWKNFISGYFGFIYRVLNEGHINAILLSFKLCSLIAFSWFSYRFIERPFLNLKKYFV